MPCFPGAAFFHGVCTAAVFGSSSEMSLSSTYHWSADNSPSSGLSFSLLLHVIFSLTNVFWYQPLTVWAWVPGLCSELHTLDHHLPTPAGHVFLIFTQQDANRKDLTQAPPAVHISTSVKLGLSHDLPLKPQASIFDPCLSLHTTSRHFQSILAWSRPAIITLCLHFFLQLSFHFWHRINCPPTHCDLFKEI